MPERTLSFFKKLYTICMHVNLKIIGTCATIKKDVTIKNFTTFPQNSIILAESIVFQINNAPITIRDAKKDHPSFLFN